MKRFLLKLTYTLLPVVLLLGGTMVYYYTQVQPYETGDLGALGKIPFARMEQTRPPQAEFHTLLYAEVRDASNLRATPCDMLTVGDSFCQQGVRGFQNYLTLLGLRCVNYRASNVYTGNPFQNTWNLLHYGHIDSTCVRTLVVESAERYLATRLTALDCQAPDRRDEPAKPKPQATDDEGHEPWSLVEAKNYLLLRLHVVPNPARQARLTRRLFDGGHSNQLFYFQEDVTQNLSITPPQGRLMMRNLATLRQAAQERGIELQVLVCPDKYDLYQDYIAGPHPRKMVNEDLRRLTGNDPHVLIAKEWLLPLVQRGVPDVFPLADVHWSPQAARLTAQHVAQACKTANTSRP